MPERVEPCLALLTARPPVGDDWAFEVKWDGYRLAIHIEPGGKIRIITRGHDWTPRFPTVTAAAAELEVESGQRRSLTRLRCLVSGLFGTCTRSLLLWTSSIRLGAEVAPVRRPRWS